MERLADHIITATKRNKDNKNKNVIYEVFFFFGAFLVAAIMSTLKIIPPNLKEKRSFPAFSSIDI